MTRRYVSPTGKRRKVPELPEVETVRRAMERHLVGRRIADIWTSGKRLREPQPRARLKSLVGERFEEARRRAKYLLLAVDSGRVLLVHLGMTGNLIFRPNPQERDLQKHDHLIIGLDSGPPLVFADPRRFGLLLVLDSAELETSPYLSKLGVEPLSSDFDAEYLRNACRGRKRPIKNILLDGRVVVGIGNIYASEALFHAGIRPAARAGRLTRAQLGTLTHEIKMVLRRAVRQGGTTINDYLGSGEGGRFQQELAVYGRTDEDCLVCERPVKSVVLAWRSSFYCANCQK